MSRLQVLKSFGLVVLLWGQICYCSDTELLEESSDASGYHLRLIHIHNQESLLIATLPFFCFVNITYFENSSLGCLGMTFSTLYFLFTLKSSFDSQSLPGNLILFMFFLFQCSIAVSAAESWEELFSLCVCLQ